MAEKKTKKDAYTMALNAYSQAIKSFRKNDCQKTIEVLTAFQEKYVSEKELVERASMYIEICKNRLAQKDPVLKSYDDYFRHSVYKINQREFQDAENALQKAIELNPKEGKLYYMMATLNHLMDEDEKCLEFLRKAIEIDDFFRILAGNEADFDDIRENEDFKSIIANA